MKYLPISISTIELYYSTSQTNSYRNYKELTCNLLHRGTVQPTVHKLRKRIENLADGSNSNPVVTLQPATKCIHAGQIKLW